MKNVVVEDAERIVFQVSNGIFLFVKLDKQYLRVINIDFCDIISIWCGLVDIVKLVTYLL